jgi:hypothetical protein
MKRLFFYILIPLITQGCVYFHENGDEDHRFGISTHRYRDCVEYYDASGVYHRDCNDALFEFGFNPELKISIGDKDKCK